MGSEEEEHAIVIVGGGIVGLATALALHRKGIQSLVLEKSGSLRATGAAIGVFVNGWRALDQLNVGTTLRMKAIPIVEIHDALVNWNKTRAMSCRNEALRCLKRSDIVDALANELPEKSIRFGCHIVAIGADPLTSFPIVHLDDGTNIKAKVLIGCDGSNSVVARSLGLETPRIFPIYAVRGFTNYPNGHTYGGNGFRLRKDQAVFGRIPIDDTLVYWFLSWRAQTIEVDMRPQRIRDSVLERLREFPTDVVEIVEHCDLDSLSLTHIRYRAPWNLLFQNFWRGTTTVAGDAMHVMGPFLGQGGSCGLEDAVVLARCLAREMQLIIARDHGNNDHEFKKRVAVALEDYSKQRRLRVSRLAIQSYLVGSMVVATTWVKRLVCIVILKAFFGGMSLSHTRYDCGSL